jgi:hypothetical protein
MNPISGIFKMFYWPICRTYGRHLGNKPADSLFRFLCGFQFLKTYGSWPNFKKPRRFSEKVWSRQLHERDPLYTLISDKLRVRDYVADKVGGDYLVPLLWSGSKPEEIPFDKLPLKFVIKMNHGCGYNILVKDKARLDRALVDIKLEKWANENFCEEKYLGIAWAYKNIKPQVIIETFLEEDDRVPEDYKFFCFSGRVEFFKLDFDRFEDHSVKYFDRDFKKLDLTEEGFEQYQGEIELPDDFEHMVQVAESLAKGFDFVRVDLYYVNRKIYFGELTLYPGGISNRFEPDSFDYIFGEKWLSK